MKRFLYIFGVACLFASLHANTEDLGLASAPFRPAPPKRGNFLTRLVHEFKTTRYYPVVSASYTYRSGSYSYVRHPFAQGQRIPDVRLEPLPRNAQWSVTYVQVEHANTYEPDLQRSDLRLHYGQHDVRGPTHVLNGSASITRRKACNQSVFALFWPKTQQKAPGQTPPRTCLPHNRE